MAMNSPGIATRPNACFQPQELAIIPPAVTPMAEPIGIDAFHRPIIFERFSIGYIPEMSALPPGAYPASPKPISTRARNSWT